MLGNRGFPEAWSHLCVCQASFLMTFAMGGVPHAGPRHFLVHHHLPELAQTHVCWVGDAIQSSYPLSSPSPPTFNLSQHQGFFQWVSFSYQAANILELQLQHQSFQWKSMTDFLYDWLVWSPCCLRDSQESSPTTQFKSISSSELSLLYSSPPTSIYDYWKSHSLDYMDLLGKVMSLLVNKLSRFVIAFLPRSKRL